MFRRVSLALTSAAALAACETPASTPPMARIGGPMPSTHPIYDPRASAGASYAGARAPVHTSLRACKGFEGAVTGGVGWDGEILAYTPFISAPSGRLLRNPTDGACYSSGFGWRPAATGGGRNHEGLDLANPDGGAVYAAGDGRVVSVGWKSGYGLAIEIDHGRGVRTLYGHLSASDARVRAGVRVPIGGPIGRMGSTGNATGVHLHYEVSVYGRKVDPLTYAPWSPDAS